MLRIFISCLVFMFTTPTYASNYPKDEDAFVKSFVLLNLDVYETMQAEATCKALLDTTTDLKIRSTTVRIVTTFYPYNPRKSIDLLHLLLRKLAVESLEEAKKIEELFVNRRLLLGDNPTLLELSGLIDSSNPEKSVRLQKELALYQANINGFLYRDFGLDCLNLNSPADKACLVVHDSLRHNYRYLDEAQQSQRIDDFINFGNLIADDLNPQSYMALWGRLAKSYLEIAVDAFVDHRQYDVCSNYFIPELSDFIKRKTTSYEWFILFCERLTILMADPHDLLVDMENNRKNDDFNVKIGNYFCGLYGQTYQDIPAWYTHNGFLSAGENVGSFYTHNRHSLKALSADFPAEILLPWVGDLGLVDILRTIPNPNKNRVWLLGFLPRKTIADGSKLTSPIFWGHDKFHKANINSILCTGRYLFAVCEHFIAPTVQGQWAYLRQGRKLFFDSLTAVLRLVDQPGPKDQVKMNKFFSFYVFHEGTNTLEDRLLSLIDSGNAMYGHVGLYESLMNKDMYFLHLPKRLQNAPNQTDFNMQYIAYAKRFVEVFSENRSLVDEIKTWLQSSDSIFKTIGCLSVLDRNRNLSFYDKKESFLKTTLDEFKDAMNGVCETTTVMRRYFFGPVTYLGEDPPQTLEQVWKLNIN